MVLQLSELECGHPLLYYSITVQYFSVWIAVIARILVELHILTQGVIITVTVWQLKLI